MENFHLSLYLNTQAATEDRVLGTLVSVTPDCPSNQTQLYTYPAQWIIKEENIPLITCIISWKHCKDFDRIDNQPGETSSLKSIVKKGFPQFEQDSHIPSLSAFDCISRPLPFQCPVTVHPESQQMMVPVRSTYGRTRMEPLAQPDLQAMRGVSGEQTITLLVCIQIIK